MNRYVLKRPDQGIIAIVAAEDEYEARLTVQRTLNRSRAGRPWMSSQVEVELIEVLTSDLEPEVIMSTTIGR
jgi:hypothetical protein